jgi:hypothetical protein
MAAKIGKSVEVRLEGIEIRGELYDFWFLVKPPPYSLYNRIRKEKPDDSDMPDIVTVELLGQHIKEWKSVAFEDADTDEMLACTPENLAQVLEDCAEMYGVFNHVLMRSHMDTVRKNSATSPAGTSTEDEDSAKGAETTNESPAT